VSRIPRGDQRLVFVIVEDVSYKGLLVIHLIVAEETIKELYTRLRSVCRKAVAIFVLYGWNSTFWILDAAKHVSNHIAVSCG
jgi:hypothetical protein